MFGVDRGNEGLRIFGKLVPDDGAGHNHGFFIGKCHMLAVFNGGNGREATHCTHQGVDDDVGLRVCSKFAEAIHTGEHRLSEQLFKFLCSRFVEHAHAFHIELAYNFSNLIDAAVGSNRVQIEDIRML